jgi:hypothetical protein
MKTRRDFLKLSGIFLGAVALPSWSDALIKPYIQLSQSEKLGRICAGAEGAWFDLKTEPSENAPSAGIVWRDEVVIWKREVIAKELNYLQYNQKWVETPNGYIYAPLVQPVKNILNEPLSALPENSDGKPGLWVEITVPVVDIIPDSTPVSYWIREVLRPRIYYSQVFWAYDIRQYEGKVQYKLTEKYGAESDSYWADASACRPITSDEIAPIHPDASNKHILVNLNYQTLSCLEGENEVYFCEVSSGGIMDGEWMTPIGIHTIWRKMVSTHMSAGGLSEFDTPGIAWTTLFDNQGAAIHAAFWHNFFGTARSHGCINCRPEDAKWIWRWTNPEVGYFPGELTVQGGENSTKVEVYV